MKTIFHIVTIIALLPFTSVAAPDYWNESAYAVECKKTPVKEVLQDFSRAFGVNLIASDKVNGICNSWRRADTAVAFLDQLSNEFRLQWFVYKGNLYVSPTSDNRTRRLDANEEFKGAIEGLGLFQEKFGWGDLPGNDTIIVTGPAKYVDLVARLARKENEIQERQETGNVHVFKLQYAPVEDRKITIRDEERTIPGVASILKSLLTGTSGKLQDFSPGDGPGSATSKLKKRKKDGVAIEADIRTNSILIRSPTKDFSYYKSIVDQLDVSSNLIEIDAIIVDVSREKLKELGVNFSFSDKKSRGSISTETTASTNRILDSDVNANATILIKDLGLFKTSLKALEGEGDASIIANTSILTMDNQPAFIDLSETVYLQSVGERVVDVQPVTAGTLLSVTPMAMETDDGSTIKLVIDIEDGKLLQADTQSAAPRVQKTRISTKAVVSQNRSLVIGGYHVQKTVRRDSGIPALRSVPGVGSLFNTKISKNTHQERLFILTPRTSPTYHNPEDYSSTGSADLIAGAVERIKERWSMANKSYVEKTKLLLQSLASGKIPNEYTFETTHMRDLGFECYQNGLTFQFEDGQKVTGHGLTAFVGVVTNTSSTRRSVDESSCRGRGVVGVSVFPSVDLDSAASSEIFVSMETARINTSQRKKLAGLDK